MIGRAMMNNPWMFRHADDLFYHTEGPRLTRREVVMKYVDYVEQFINTHRNDWWSLFIRGLEAGCTDSLQAADHFV